MSAVKKPEWEQLFDENHLAGTSFSLMVLARASRALRAPPARKSENALFHKMLTFHLENKGLLKREILWARLLHK